MWIWIKLASLSRYEFAFFFFFKNFFFMNLKNKKNPASLGTSWFKAVPSTQEWENLQLYLVEFFFSVSVFIYKFKMLFTN